MINRIFKTILVLSIVLGITLPSNAAVSVSDGSAFVTKAEFAADLNNLSNRMAQLENSLDAKIDSLVSSYLTRNGIWNGAKQDLKYTKVMYDMYDLYGTFKELSIATYLVTNYGTANTTNIEKKSCTVMGYDIPADNSLLAHRVEIVEETNKSGLLTIEYVGAIASCFTYDRQYNNVVKWFDGDTGYENLLEIPGCFTSGAVGTGNFVGVTAGQNDDVSFWTLRKGFKFLEGTDSGGYTYKTNRVLSTSNSAALGMRSIPRIQSASGAGRPYQYTAGVVNGIVNPQLCFDTFFVTKGSKILIEVYDDWSGRNYSSDNKLYTMNGQTRDQLKSLIACQINAIYIY